MVALHVVRLQLVTTLLLKDQYHGQITISIVPTIEESMHDVYHRRELAVARRTVHGQWADAFFKPGREDKGGKIGTMVNVEVREQDHVELGHFRATLFESKSAATTSIY
jgi:hypothetical protein